MKSIYLSSNSDSAGKTTITLGLALKLKEKGFKVGYMKPSGRMPVGKDYGIYDEDALFINDVLGLKEPLDALSPFVFDSKADDELSGSTMSEARRSVLGAYRSFGHKDFLLLGGGSDIFDGTTLDIGILDLLEDLDAKAVVVDKWRGFATADTILGAARLFGDRCIGGIINKVPPNLVSHVKNSIKPYIERNGVRVLGIFPKDKLLESITVRKLIEAVNGEILCCERKLDEYVENFLIGAMDAESAMKHFTRMSDKAVITGAHRTDIQLAAIETSAKCIIITGGLRTSDMILGQAISRGVPIISVSEDTFTTVDNIENSLKRVTIREKGKVVRAKELVDRELDMDGLLAAFS